MLIQKWQHSFRKRPKKILCFYSTWQIFLSRYSLHFHQPLTWDEVISERNSLSHIPQWPIEGQKQWEGWDFKNEQHRAHGECWIMTSSISKWSSYAETPERNKWRLPEWSWQPLPEGTERNCSFLQFFKYNKLFLDKSWPSLGRTA